MDVVREYAVKLAKAQADPAVSSLEAMKASGAKATILSEQERKRWAQLLPDIPMEWAKDMEAKVLPGREVVRAYLEGIRARGKSW